jgi:drug/metabolite transporter (DMT)-like permease
MTSSPLGLPALYLSIFLLALTGLFAKLIPLDATSIIQLRSVVAAVGLASFMAAQRRRPRLRGLRAYVGVYALGLLLGLHWVTFFHAMQVSSVAVGMLAMFTFPIITILLEPFFTTRKLMMGDLVAGLVVLAGLGIMVGPGLTDLRLPVTQGVLFGLFSALLFALRNLLQKYLYVGESSDGLILHQVIAIALVLIPFVDYPRAQALNGAGVVNILLLGLLSTAAGHTLLAFSLKQLPAKSVALIQCLQPPLAALLAWWVIGETPGAAVLIGGGMILSIAAYESLRQTRGS